MSAIDELFSNLRASGKKAFMPFLSAGDPSIAATARLIRELANAGVHLFEIGFPFSDPIADGPVIQASYTRALEHGLKTDDIFRCVSALTHGADGVPIPLAAMASYSLIYRRGPREFVRRAADAGFAGIIAPDLPVEEAAELADLAREKNRSLILLVTPTTPAARAEKIVRLCSGFVYCVSVAGTTGERDRLPEALLIQLRQLRQMTDLPLCVGFGVGKPEHVRALREVADGVIVGSAIVRRLENCTEETLDRTVREIVEFVKPLLAALNP